VRPVDVTAVAGHRAPGRIGRADPEADEREERLAEDHCGQLEEDRDDEDAERVRQQMAHEDPVPARADRLRRTHVIVLLQRQHLPAHDARGREPGRDRERDHHRPDVRVADDRERDDRKREIGQSVERVEEAHQPVVQPPADEARDRAVDDADGQDREGRAECDQDRDAAA
jgi:hypothetical protein